MGNLHVPLVDFPELGSTLWGRFGRYRWHRSRFEGQKWSDTTIVGSIGRPYQSGRGSISDSTMAKVVDLGHAIFVQATIPTFKGSSVWSSIAGIQVSCHLSPTHLITHQPCCICGRLHRFVTRFRIHHLSPSGVLHGLCSSDGCVVTTAPLLEKRFAHAAAVIVV